MIPSMALNTDIAFLIFSPVLPVVKKLRFISCFGAMNITTMISFLSLYLAPNYESSHIENNRFSLTTVLKPSKISMILDDSSTKNLNKDINWPKGVKTTPRLILSSLKNLPSALHSGKSGRKMDTLGKFRQ